MIARKQILVLALLFNLSMNVFAQSPQFSQFWLDKVGTNPALVGDDMGVNLNMVTRTQWTRITSHFNTFGICGDVYLPGGGGTGLGIGFNAQSNTEGEGYMRTQKFEMAFSGWGTFGSMADFSIGISAGVIDKRITNPDGLVFSDQLDPVVGAIYPTSYQFDKLTTGFKGTINGGVVGRVFLSKDHKRRGPIPFSKYLMAGFSMSNLNRPQLTFNDNSSFSTPVRYTLHISYNHTNGNSKDDKQTVIQPYLVFNIENTFKSTTIGSRFFMEEFQWFTAFRFGEYADFNKSDALIFGLALSKKLGQRENDKVSAINFSYSYDFTLNGIGINESSGSHEIGIRYRWNGGRYNGNYMRDQGHRKAKQICPTVW